MPTYLSPGVYMEEVDKGTKPIEAVGTAVAAFIGYTERASETRDGKTTSLLGKPSLVTNWSQYVAKFGGFVEGAYLPDSVYGYFANGGTICYILSIKTIGEAADAAEMIAARTLITAGDKKTNLLEFTAKNAGIAGNNISVEVKPIDAAPAKKGEDDKAADAGLFTLVVNLNGKPAETYENVTAAKGERNVVTVVQQQSKLIEVKLTGKADLVPAAGVFSLSGGEVKSKAISLGDYQGDSAQRTGLGGLEPLEDITMICVPDLMMSYQRGETDMKGVQAVQTAIITYCEQVRYCFAVLMRLLA